MTRRENHTRILTRNKGEFLTFVPNFDHWLNVNRSRGSLPEKHVGMSRNDIVRQVNGTIWARTSILEQDLEPEIKIRKKEYGDKILTEYQTPAGQVYTVHQYTSDFTRALFLKEHWIKKREDIKVVKFIAQHSRYKINPEPFLESEKDVGQDGISLVGLPTCLPYIHSGKNDCGWETGIYLLADYPEEVEDLLELYEQKAEETAELLCQGPAQVIASRDNMDEWTTPPSAFKKYAIAYYRKISAILHKTGKVFQVHWCGRTRHLLPFVPECGIDVVEAVAVKPMADLTVPETLKEVGENVIIQRRVTFYLFCPQGGSTEQLKEYVLDLLEKVPHGFRFALGMSDNVFPDADFERVETVNHLV